MTQAIHTSSRTMNEPYKITLAFVSRESFNVHKRKMFTGRNQAQLLLKMAAWVYAFQDDYPPEKFMLIAIVNGSRKPEAIIESLKRSKIPVFTEDEFLKKFGENNDVVR